MWIVCFNWFTFSMILAFCSSHLLFTIQFKLWQNRFNINCAQPSSILREAQKIWLAPFASSHTRLVCKMLLWILAQQTFCIHNSVEFYSRIIRNTISLAPVLFHQFRKIFYHFHIAYECAMAVGTKGGKWPSIMWLESDAYLIIYLSWFRKHTVTEALNAIQITDNWSLLYFNILMNHSIFQYSNIFPLISPLILIQFSISLSHFR